MKEFGLLLTGVAGMVSGYIMKYSIDHVSVEALFWGIGVWLVMGGLGVTLNIKD